MEAVLSLRSIFDKEFYEKVVTIAENACLITKKKHPLDSDTYNTHARAVECFFQKQYLATVFFASVGVERYLNKTLKRQKWKFLSSGSIMEAYKAGMIAVAELLDASEKSVLQTGKPKPLFCERRNKILHGDIEGLVKIKGTEIENNQTGLESESSLIVISFQMSAYDQLLKFQKFLLKI